MRRWLTGTSKMKLGALLQLLAIERYTSELAGKMKQTMDHVALGVLSPMWEDLIEEQARWAFHCAGHAIQLRHRLGLPVLGDPTLYPPSAEERVNQEVI